MFNSNNPCYTRDKVKISKVLTVLLCQTYTKRLVPNAMNIHIEKKVGGAKFPSVVVMKKMDTRKEGGKTPLSGYNEENNQKIKGGDFAPLVAIVKNARRR